MKVEVIIKFVALPSDRLCPSASLRNPLKWSLIDGLYHAQSCPEPRLRIVRTLAEVGRCWPGERKKDCQRSFEINMKDLFLRKFANFHHIKSWMLPSEKATWTVHHTWQLINSFDKIWENSAEAMFTKSSRTTVSYFQSLYWTSKF